jgi:hypothetical protein
MTTIKEFIKDNKNIIDSIIKDSGSNKFNDSERSKGVKI